METRTCAAFILATRKKKRGCGGNGVVWGRHASFVFTHTQTCQTGTLFFHPLQPSAANCASVSCVSPARSQRFPIRLDHRMPARRQLVRNLPSLSQQERCGEPWRHEELLSTARKTRWKPQISPTGGQINLRGGFPFYLQICDCVLIRSGRPSAAPLNFDLFAQRWSGPRDELVLSCSWAGFCSRVGSLLQVSVCFPSFQKKQPEQTRAAFCRGGERDDRKSANVSVGSTNETGEIATLMTLFLFCFVFLFNKY